MLAGSRSVTVLALIVAPFIASLNVAEGVTLTLTPVAPFAGETAATVGGVVSAAAEPKTTSTQ